MKKVLAMLFCLSVPLHAQVIQSKAATEAELTAETNARIAADATKANTASPTFTGKVTTAASTTSNAGFRLPHGVAPTTPINGDLWSDSSGVYSYVNGVGMQFAPLASPTFTGVPAAPTAATGTNTTQLATTAYAQTELLKFNGQRRVFYTSSTCTSDSNLTIGTASTGADQTTALQAILDQATAGPIMVIWDGKYTAGRLRIRGNTHIKGLPGCGVILKANAGTPLFENYNRTFATGTVAVGPDENIILEDLVINGNRPNQSTLSNATEGWLVTLRFVGAKNIHYRNLKLLTGATFLSQMANCEDVYIENTYIDTNQADTQQNQDGLHFHGPMQNCVVKNTAGYTGDDIISFTANDIGERGPDQAQNMLGSLGQPYGDIKDIVIDGLDLKFSNYGIRLLSSTNLMDRVHINNVTGYTRYHHWLIVGANIPNYSNPTGRGNFGTIMVTNCSAVVPDAVSDEFIQLDGRIDTIIFRNIRRHSAPAPGGYATHVPTWRIEADAKIGNLVVDGYSYGIKNDRYYRSTPTYTGLAQIHIENLGHIGKLDLINPSITRHWSGAADGELVKNTGSIRILNKSGVVGINLADVLTGNAPTVTNAHTTDYLPSPTTVWSTGTLNLYAETLEGGYMDDPWDESSLYLHYPYSNTEVAIRAGNDGLGGNVKVKARIQFLNLPQTGTMGIFARGTGNTASSITSGYAVVAYAPSTTTVAFRLGFNGTLNGDFIGSDHVITTSALIPYDLEVNCNGSTISGYVQRSTDGYYLTNSNTWSVTRQPFETATNTAHAAAAGQNGIINWQSNPSVGAKRSVLDYTLSAAE
jgi:hypothetical protein